VFQTNKQKNKQTKRILEVKYNIFPSRTISLIYNNQAPGDIGAYQKPKNRPKFSPKPKNRKKNRSKPKKRRE